MNTTYPTQMRADRVLLREAQENTPDLHYQRREAIDHVQID